jgi:hypothetical protein
MEFTFDALSTAAPEVLPVAPESDLRGAAQLVGTRADAVYGTIADLGTEDAEISVGTLELFGTTFSTTDFIAAVRTVVFVITLPSVCNAVSVLADHDVIQRGAAPCT